MNQSQYKISFISTDRSTKFSDLSLDEGVCLSKKLTVQNSPILFGCRTGICGTCLVRLHGENAAFYENERTSTEHEYLSELYSDITGLRLACQMTLNRDVILEKVKV